MRLIDWEIPDKVYKDLADLANKVAKEKEKEKDNEGAKSINRDRLMADILCLCVEKTFSDWGWS